MSCMPTSSIGWLVFTSTITTSALWTNDGVLPTDVEGMMPSSVIATASTRATSILPRNPSRACCATCERCMSM